MFQITVTTRYSRGTVCIRGFDAMMTEVDKIKNAVLSFQGYSGNVDIDVYDMSAGEYCMGWYL